MTQNAGQYVPNRGQNSWRRCPREARGPGPGELGSPSCPVRLVGPGEPAQARGVACRIWPNRASSSRADPLLPNPSAIHWICAIGRKKSLAAELHGHSYKRRSLLASACNFTGGTVRFTAHIPLKAQRASARGSALSLRWARPPPCFFGLNLRRVASASLSYQRRGSVASVWTAEACGDALQSDALAETVRPWRSRNGCHRRLPGRTQRVGVCSSWPPDTPRRGRERKPPETGSRGP